MAKIDIKNHQIGKAVKPASSFEPGDLMRCVEGRYSGSIALRLYPDTFVVFDVETDGFGRAPVAVTASNKEYSASRFVLAEGETVTIME